MKPGQYRHPHSDSISQSRAPVARLEDTPLDGPLTALFSAALAALHEGFSVIPLIGGNDPTRGKRPAIKWKTYTKQLPTEAVLNTWFVDRAHTAYGIVCGPVSRLIVLDLDDGNTAWHFAEQFPHLMKTRIVLSGLRGTPHIYWRIDCDTEHLGKFASWSKSRKVNGGDLKGQGGYVVGPGSSIAGGEWEIINDSPIRTISPGELNEALNMLAAPTGQKQPHPAKSTSNAVRRPQQQNAGDFAALYRNQVTATGQRNNALFDVVCHIRDAGYPQQWAAATLSDLHAVESPHDGQRQENHQQRIAEACATIASVYSRPARRKATTEAPASRLPNAIRERLLQQTDGAAIIRTLEGLYLKGLRPGDTFTEKDACHLLKGIVGRHSVIIFNNFNRFFDLVQDQPSTVSPPCNPLYPANADEAQKDKHCKKTCCLSSGQNQTKGRPSKQYVYPNVEDLCAYLGVEPSGGDPLYLEDLQSPKTLRMALEREFIKRRPGQYFQDLLAARLGVSDRTIRRYHRDIPIFSLPQYLETPVFRFNLYRIPTADTIKRYDLDLGGQFLEDDTGKRWPLKQEIARMLLSRGRRVTHKVKTASTYYFGNALPPPPRPVQTWQFEPLPVEQPSKLEIAYRELVENKDIEVQNASGVSDNTPDTTVTQLPLLPGVDPKVATKPSTTESSSPASPKRRSKRRGKRYYNRPLIDTRLEALANDLHAQVDRLSVQNARQLVDAYGSDLVKQTLGKMRWLQREGKLRNPAGFMITATRIAWKEQHGWGGEQPAFESRLPHNPRQAAPAIDPHADLLWQSEAYRGWRDEFIGWDGDHLLGASLAVELPY